MQDDPVCVAARKDGKKVVTEQWVDDSFDLGVLADADRVSLPIPSDLLLFNANTSLRFQPVTHLNYSGLLFRILIGTIRAGKRCRGHTRQ